jgi:hypothetical protein
VPNFSCSICQEGLTAGTNNIEIPKSSAVADRALPGAGREGP